MARILAKYPKIKGDAVRRIKLLIGLLVALLMLGAMSAPTVSAQPVNGLLSDVWLKCMVSGKAYTVDQNGYHKTNGSRPVYLHFVGTGPPYDVEVWTLQDGTSDWLNLNPIKGVSPTQPGENFISNFFLKLQFSDTDYIETYHTPLITYKGGKVTYKGTGEISYGEFNNFAVKVYGYFNIHGTSVDSTKLPFTPLAPPPGP
jgi:hypothetical protein